MPNPPIFQEVAAAQGWSPDDLGPRFDLAWFMFDNRAKVAASRMLRDVPGAVVLPFPTAPATAPRGTE